MSIEDDAARATAIADDFRAVLRHVVGRTTDESRLHAWLAANDDTFLWWPSQCPTCGRDTCLLYLRRHRIHFIRSTITLT